MKKNEKKEILNARHHFHYSFQRTFSSGHSCPCFFRLQPDWGLYNSHFSNPTESPFIYRGEIKCGFKETPSFCPSCLLDVTLPLDAFCSSLWFWFCSSPQQSASKLTNQFQIMQPCLYFLEYLFFAVQLKLSQKYLPHGGRVFVGLLLKLKCHFLLRFTATTCCNSFMQTFTRLFLFNITI